MLYQIYGFEEYSTAIAPQVKKVEAVGNKIVITFDTDVKTELGISEVEGFEITGGDWEYVRAKGTISGNTITLEAEGVTQPLRVRYGYGDFDIELHDGTILPYDTTECTIELEENSIKIISPDGKEYVFERDTELVIRSKIKGNVTNSSGHPLPVFKFDVGYVSE